jgi:phosphatidylglycerol:prolipoprotein diacylglycerol transferase
MRQTLFFIPEQVANIPMFGLGLLLALWLLGGVLVLFVLVRKQGFNADTKSYLPVFVIVALAIIFVLPNLLEAGNGLPVRSYGVMTMLAIISAIALANYRAIRYGISKETIYAFAFGFCVAGFIGARIFHVIEYWEISYRKESLDGSIAFVPTMLAIVNVPQGGLVVYGALIGGMIAFIYLVRRFHLPPLAFADFIAPSMVLGLAIGRIGCLLNGCCFGGLCEVPWAVTFPQNSPPYNQQLERGLLWGVQIGSDTSSNQVLHHSELSSESSKPREGLQILWRNSELAQRGLKVGESITRINGVKSPPSNQLWNILNSTPSTLEPTLIETQSGEIFSLQRDHAQDRSRPIHPTQIYSSISAFLLCMVLLAYAPLRSRDGEVFGLMITIYPVIRILLEIIRTDEIAQFGTGLSISQLVSLFILTGVSVYWIMVFRQPSGTLRLSAEITKNDRLQS